MNRVTALIPAFLFAFSSVAFSSVALASDTSARPNIVLIMADDMGYSDIGCYGSEIRTPTLDRLAANGLRLTQFYNTSRCCPTRAALLTGLYSHQAGIGLMTGDRGWDAYKGDLNQNCRTIAEVLKTAGYRNYMSGKWHVTKHTSPNGPKHNWPLQRGFDRFYGTIIGAGSFYDPATLCRGNKFITPVNDTEYRPESFYYSDAISDNAVQYIREHSKEHKDSPFFLYVSYTSAHWPMHAPEKDIAKYRGFYNRGFNATRKARYKKAICQGVIDPKWNLTPAAANWNKNPHKEWDIRCMEVYAAMVDNMDQGIGRVVGELKRNDLLDDTLIIYLQDNGGCAEGYGRASNAKQIKDVKHKPLGPNDLQTRIWPQMQTRDGRAVRTGPETMPGAADTFVAYGLGWANVSNTPFKGFKHDGFEGGISTPLIAHWPKGIRSELRNSIAHQPAHLIDLLPTFIKISGADYPEKVGRNVIKPLEGISLDPLFQGQKIRRTQPLAFEHHGNLALRDGPWKIVSAYRRNESRRWHLYNMENDRTELRDLAGSHPDKLEELIEKWQTWADRVGVQDWPFKNKPQRN